VSIKLKVTGMTCPHCVNSVKKALEAVPGVVQAEVFLETGEALVSGGVEVTRLLEAVKEAGYSAEQVSA